ncbi:MAG: hypothetical protein M1514_02000 [Patescibacteria group bacterium]|nr:hypothetical protein [Patescibacteria group bacterium]
MRGGEKYFKMLRNPTFLVVLFFLFVFSSLPAQAKTNKMVKSVSQDIKKENQEVKKSFWQSLKEQFPFLLPSGIKQGEIVNVSSTAIPAEVKVKTNGQEIILKITDETEILRKFGGKSSLSELKAGHQVTARGTWVEKGVTLETKVLRDLSIEKRKGTFWGKVKSIDNTQKSLVLDTGRGLMTVFVNEATKIVDLREKVVNFLDLAINHRLRVTGIWDTKFNQIEETQLIKDWSLPLKTPTATPTPR